MPRRPKSKSERKHIKKLTVEDNSSCPRYAIFHSHCDNREKVCYFLNKEKKILPEDTFVEDDTDLEEEKKELDRILNTTYPEVGIEDINLEIEELQEDLNGI